MTVQATDDRWQERKHEWVRRIAALADDVERWATAEGWPVHREQKQIRERLVGEYQAPVLRIRVPGGDIYLTPVALHVVGADGRVDLEAWPTLNRVKLVGRDGRWEIVTDSNVPLREPWDRDQFVRLVHDLHA